MTRLVEVETGRLRGVPGPDGITASYLGVPYAAPPVGELRWRPPQPAKPWTGVRDASTFGPASRQPIMPSQSIYFGGESDFSEDCLYLNVWTGSQNPGSRPVMVWLHPGAYQFGSGANPLYNGTALARAGITLVTLNHRLGRLGFFTHPLLSAESGQGSGNYGLMDIVAALEWIQRNIAKFGGNPGNVTLFGVSAGGNSVHTLRACPSARGLFHRGIAQSGPGFGPVLSGLGHAAAPQTLAAGEQAGEEVADRLGIASLDQLRSLPAADLEGVVLPRAIGPWRFKLLPGASVSTHVFDSGYPVVDGHFLPETPQAAHAHGRQLDIPMIIGHAGNEASGLPYLTTLEDYDTFAREEFGEFADEFLSLYPAGSDDQVQQATWDLEADRTFIWSSWTAARAQRTAGTAPVFYYRFDREPPIPQNAGIIEASYARAFHTGEVPYVFGNLDVRDWPWSTGDRDLATAISRAWQSFAATGDPNVSGVTEWPVLEESAPSALLWDVKPTVGFPVNAERMELLDRFNKVWTGAAAPSLGNVVTS
jgi:para-nitrobenzyl esterase